MSAQDPHVARDRYDLGESLRNSSILSSEKQGWAESFAGLLEGSSEMYVVPPGPESPIGKWRRIVIPLIKGSKEAAGIY